MGSVCAGLHWAPKQFWDATLHEIVSIIEIQEELYADAGRTAGKN